MCQRCGVGHLPLLREHNLRSIVFCFAADLHRHVRLSAHVGADRDFGACQRPRPDAHFVEEAWRRGSAVERPECRKGGRAAIGAVVPSQRKTAVCGQLGIVDLKPVGRSTNTDLGAVYKEIDGSVRAGGNRGSKRARDVVEGPIEGGRRRR